MDAEKDLLTGLARRLEEDLNLVKKLSEMTDEARAALGLSVEPVLRAEERARVKILQSIAGEVREVLEQISTLTGGCTSWLEINGGRIACELPAGHADSHARKLIARVEKERIDATISWVMQPFIKAV
jgi:hypothetical protein